jgi:hypothetical protein
MADSQQPKPDSALQRLNHLVGRWIMLGRPVGSSKDSITGTTTFQWLHGNSETSFFLQQDMEMNYDGQIIKSREIIGYDPKTRAFSSYVYSNMAPDPWPYTWDIQGDDLTIRFSMGLWTPLSRPNSLPMAIVSPAAGDRVGVQMK